MKSQVPISFASRLEMIQHIAAGEEEKRTLVLDRDIKMQEAQEKEQQILSLLAEGEANAVQKSQRFDQMKLALSTLNEQQRLLIGDLESQIQVLNEEKLSLSHNMERMQSEMEHSSSQMNNYKAEIKDTVKSFETRLYELREKQKLELAEQKQIFERMLREEKEVQDNVSVQNLNLKVQVNSLRSDNEGLKKSLSLKDEIISGKNSELKIKSTALQKKDTTMSGLSRQLSTANQFLAMKQQSLQASITWNQCADLPMDIPIGTSTIIADKVYFSGAIANEKDECNVYCYYTSKDEWSILPPLDIRLFSLGQLQGRLVAIGGAKKRPSKERTNEVFTFIENGAKWKKTYASMPTARSSTVVLCLESTLIVTGGFAYLDGKPIASQSVELFKTSDLQWYTCKNSANLPFSSISASGVIMNSNVYMMSGIRIGVDRNDVAYVSVDDLIHHAVPANLHSQKPLTTDHSSQTGSLWKMLPETPMNKAAISMLNGSLIAIGGEEGVGSENGTSTIHMYSPSINTWINIGSLPAGPRPLTTVTVLSPTEIIMIGGFDGIKDVKTVYKGVLRLIT